MDRKRAAADSDLLEEDEEEQNEVPAPELNLKKKAVEVLYPMPGLIIHICGEIFARKLKEAARVDCTCMTDPDYVDGDECNKMLRSFAWLADQIHAKRALVGDKVHVWVNCSLGQVRSVLTVGIYLMKYGGQSLDQAVTILRHTRGEAWYECAAGRKARVWLAAYAKYKDTIQSVKPARYNAHDQ